MSLARIFLCLKLKRKPGQSKKPTEWHRYLSCPCPELVAGAAERPPGCGVGGAAPDTAVHDRKRKVTEWHRYLSCPCPELVAGAAEGPPGCGVGGVAPDTAVPAPRVCLLLPLHGTKKVVWAVSSREKTRTSPYLF
jgi:hypothetical protein